MSTKPKIGQMGVIVKPGSCCGSTKNLGKIVKCLSYSEKDTVWCVNCGISRTTSGHYVEIGGVSSLGFPTALIDHNRVKWFNDEVDLQETQEENTKEDQQTPEGVQ